MPTSAEEREQTSAQGVSPEGVANPDVSQAYAYYVLGVLFVVTIFNYIDRQILSILLQPIKDDLKISDTALGFLTGFAFAIFYTVRWHSARAHRGSVESTQPHCYLLGNLESDDRCLWSGTGIY